MVWVLHLTQVFDGVISVRLNSYQITYDEALSYQTIPQKMKVSGLNSNQCIHFQSLFPNATIHDALTEWYELLK